jgi:hypothetical protein
MMAAVAAVDNAVAEATEKITGPAFVEQRGPFLVVHW